MARTIAIALPGVLAFASLAQAQYYPSGGGPGSAQTLINSRYQPWPQGSADRVRPSPTGRIMQERPADPEFAPLAYIQQLYVAVLGREPSNQEAGYWLQRLNYQSREEIARELQWRRPQGWLGHYDPRYGSAYDPGPGSRFYPDPASLNFRDPSGPYFKSPYFSNYQYRRPIRAFPLGARG